MKKPHSSNRREWYPRHKDALRKRDGDNCGLCGFLMDFSERAPLPQRPTIDHILPQSRGGGHEQRNLHLAHHACNTLKSNRLDDEDARVQVDYQIYIISRHRLQTHLLRLKGKRVHGVLRALQKVQPNFWKR